MSTIFPDCYDKWSLVRVIRDGGTLSYDTLYEGNEDQCREYAYENYGRDQHDDMVLMDWEGREWCV